MDHQKTSPPNDVKPFRETILIADDDPHIREVVSFALAKAGFKILEATNGKECLDSYTLHSPDLLILDILMPEMDGTEVCQKIRKHSFLPVIFLSSKDDEIDRILGLELGGDDYITKPFSPRELVARVKAVLRRGRAQESKQPSPPNQMHHGKLQLDQERFQVHWDDHEITLTSTEFGLLQTLMARPGKVYSRDELMERAYDHATLVTDRTIDSHIRRLRHKFSQVGGEPILTIRGIGYKLGPC
jgi:two-component system, OmpR family, response regulator